MMGIDGILEDMIGACVRGGGMIGYDMACEDIVRLRDAMTVEDGERTMIWYDRVMR